MSSLNFISLFAGIGGFDLALERVGFQCVEQIEIDENCQRVLEHHWPNVKKVKDVKEKTGQKSSARLLCGGFPCQDLSVAGRRAGLAGNKSGLFFQFTRIVEEVSPEWILVENVPGLLSSNKGRDMGTVVGTLAKLGYGVAWRVFDSQFFNLPQSRQRLFFVGCFGDIRRSSKVLFEPESGRTSYEKEKISYSSKTSQKINSRTSENEKRLAFCLMTKNRLISHQDTYISDNRGVRRLTPKECCRLQGFPDDWLELQPAISDTVKYHMLGNAVSVPVVEWIAKRIKENS